MHARLLPVLLAVAAFTGCTSLGKSSETALVVEDAALVPFEVKVAFHNDGASQVELAPEDFRIVGGDGTVFHGWASAREGALGTTPVPPGGSAAGWVAFRIEAKAVAPLTLVLETDGRKEEAALPGGV